MSENLNNDSENGTEDPWDTVTTELGELGRMLRDTYREVADDDGPSEDDIRGAFTTLASAFGQVAESVGSAFQDPEVRLNAKKAASALATALGSTISGLGDELQRQVDSEEE